MIAAPTRAARLAESAAELEVTDVPDDVIRNATYLILDAVGVGFTLADDQPALARSVAELSTKFPAEYCNKADRDNRYPTEFRRRSHQRPAAQQCSYPRKGTAAQ